MLRVREMDIESYRHYANALESRRGPPWRYNEMKPCGVNFDNFILAGRYDAFHQRFRDYRQEARRVRMHEAGSARNLFVGRASPLARPKQGRSPGMASRHMR